MRFGMWLGSSQDLRLTVMGIIYIYRERERDKDIFPYSIINMLRVAGTRKFDCARYVFLIFHDCIRPHHQCFESTDTDRGKRFCIPRSKSLGQGVESSRYEAWRLRCFR